jgi:hypothetical protein
MCSVCRCVDHHITCVMLGVLAFFTEWTGEDMDQEDKVLWGDNWDDDDLDAGFVNQLRQEIAKSSLN